MHWAVAGEFGSRTHFVLNESDPSSAHLAVEKVARYDEGVYRCRVDYIDSPTRNYKVNLTVIGNCQSGAIFCFSVFEVLMFLFHCLVDLIERKHATRSIENLRKEHVCNFLIFLIANKKKDFLIKKITFYKHQL